MENFSSCNLIFFLGILIEKMAASNHSSPRPSASGWKVSWLPFFQSRYPRKKSNYTWKNFLHTSIEHCVKESTIALTQSNTTCFSNNLTQRGIVTTPFRPIACLIFSSFLFLTNSTLVERQNLDQEIRVQIPVGQNFFPFYFAFFQFYLYRYVSYKIFFLKGNAHFNKKFCIPPK